MVIQTKKLYRISQLSIIGLVLYFGMRTRDAYAMDCDTSGGGPFTTAGHTYVLTGNVTGTCLIKADNITIDGNNLYSISGTIDGQFTLPGSNDGFSFTVRNIPSVQGIRSYGVSHYGGDPSPGGENGGNVIIQNSNVQGAIDVHGGYGYYSDGGIGGNVTITNSNVHNISTNGGGGAYFSSSGAAGNITLTNSIATTLAAQGGSTLGSPVNPHGGNVTLTDSDVTSIFNGGFAPSPNGTLTINDTPPSVTILGTNPLTINVGDSYVEAGATASDTKYTVTDLTSSIITTGSVGGGAGDYTITYTVSDTGTGTGITLNGSPLSFPPGIHSNTTAVTRTVHRVSTAPIAVIPTGSGALVTPAEFAASLIHNSVPVITPPTIPSVIQTTTPPPSSTIFTPVPIYTPVPPIVTQSITPPILFTKTLKSGSINTEALNLQKFLNTHGYSISSSGSGSPGKETNIFSAKTKSALMKFQKDHKLVPDGVFGVKTRGVVNSILEKQ